MLPLRDDIPSRTVPLVTMGFIGANVVAFLYQVSLQLGSDPEALRAAREFVFEFGVIPCRLTGACEAPAAFPHPVVTMFTSMFLHGGLFHIGGNMLYLWIFGNNVEDVLGHGRFFSFYLLCGLAAAAAQTFVVPDSAVPMIGASGAVSGVLGAYLLAFPHARVLTLITFGFFIRFIYIPAVVVLGFWVVVQFLNGFLTWSAAAGRGSGGGVAWFAHLGGFGAGLVLLFVLRRRRRARL
ncbi:MAG TPA: rhomboid family intramembrane serine protease [Methylomirabilota bacterium]|nr:rhomboid family intramembrane serine protease [Methylomirabilota bacterium]